MRRVDLVIYQRKEIKAILSFWKNFGYPYFQEQSSFAVS